MAGRLLEIRGCCRPSVPGPPVLGRAEPGTDAGGAGRGQDCGISPPAGNKGRFLCPAPAIWPHPSRARSQRKSRWPLASPRQLPLCQRLCLPAKARTCPPAREPPPCPNTKPSPWGIVPAAPQTLSPSCNGLPSPTPEPARPPHPCWPTRAPSPQQTQGLLLCGGQKSGRL